jgi:hypothetical protein
MVAERWFQVPPWAMLAAIAAVIALTAAASSLGTRQKKRAGSQ